MRLDSTPVRAPVLALAALLAVCSWPEGARAATCCGDGSVLGDRLGASEVAAFSTTLSARGRFGSFDEDGALYVSAVEDLDLRLQLTLDAAVRVTDWLELGAALPGVVNLRSAGEPVEVGGGLGDVAARARVTLTSSTAQRWAPGLSTSLGVVVPTGVPASATTADLAADVTGQGTGEVVLGVTADKLFEGVLLARVDGAVGLFLPASVDAERSQRAPRLSVSALTGPALGDVALALGVHYEAEAPPSTAPTGERARTRAELFVSAAADLSPTLTLLASLRSAVPAQGAGTNEIATMSAALGARVAVHGL